MNPKTKNTKLLGLRISPDAKLALERAAAVEKRSQGAMLDIMIHSYQVKDPLPLASIATDKPTPTANLKKSSK